MAPRIAEEQEKKRALAAAQIQPMPSFRSVLGKEAQSGIGHNSRFSAVVNSGKVINLFGSAEPGR